MDALAEYSSRLVSQVARRGNEAASSFASAAAAAATTSGSLFPLLFGGDEDDSGGGKDGSSRMDVDSAGVAARIDLPYFGPTSLDAVLFLGTSLLFRLLVATMWRGTKRTRAKEKTRPATKADKRSAISLGIETLAVSGLILAGPSLVSKWKPVADNRIRISEGRSLSFDALLFAGSAACWTAYAWFYFGGRRSYDSDIDPEQLKHGLVFLDILNPVREDSGLQPLSLDTNRLHKAARWFSDDMRDHGFPKRPHIGSDGSTMSQRVDRQGYPTSECVVRENILMRSDLSANGAFQQWWKSPGHKANMMAKDVEMMGLAYSCNTKKGEYYYTQVFASRVDEENLPPSSSVMSPYNVTSKRLGAAMDEARATKARLKKLAEDPETARRRKREEFLQREKAKPKGPLGLTDNLLQQKRDGLNTTGSFDDLLDSS